MIRIEEGLRYGTIVGREFVTSCSQLPEPFASQCGGAGDAFQENDEGYIVWVGEGNNPGMGLTDNLWNTSLPACVNATTGAEQPCGTGGAIVNSPFGVVANWGMPIVIRDQFGSGAQRTLGHALPDYQLSFSQTLSYKRFSAYALLDGAFGQSVWNQGRHWAFLDLLSKEVDQFGKSIEAAKPVAYYWRAPAPDAAGRGGFYDILGPNSRTVEDASYMKLREVSLSYHVGEVGGIGDWSVNVIGRNLKTWTDYTGFDPEVGVGSTNSDSGSGLINAVDAFTFPNLRSVTFALTTSF
jgi:hypothetical protein